MLRNPFGAAVLFAVASALSAAALPRTARAWGAEGHAYTADVAVRSLPLGPLSDLYTGNQVWFETNSSFLDRWRYRDNAEAARHFLRVEDFGVGIDTSRIPESYAGVLKIRSYDQLRDDGVVPWTVDRHYKLLVSAFREKRWEDALVESVCLSHYVADAHEPFHSTANDDGQLGSPSQKGLRARFEIQVVRRTITAADLKPGDPILATNPTAAILDALQSSVRQVAPLLQIDRASNAAEGDTEYGDTYWRTFLPLARPVAIARLEQGGRLLAGMLLSAWIMAGRPSPPPHFVMTDRLLPYTPELPTPDRSVTAEYPSLPDDAIDAARGRVQSFTIASRRLGKKVTSNVLLPEGYDPKAGIRYPVLYLLHGSGGSHADWNDQTGIAAYAAQLPLIVVMTDAAGDTWYVNSPKGGHWDDFFDHELIPYVDRHYMAILRREGRAIGGNSMGGYGAWYIALMHPLRFVAAASLSGALDFGTGDLGASGEEPDYGRALFGEASDPAAKREFASCQLLPLIEKQMKAGDYGGPALYFDDGKDDYLNGANRQMEQALLTLGVPYEYAEFGGEHNWTYWNAHARDMLNFVLRHLEPPQVPARTARR